MLISLPFVPPQAARAADQPPAPNTVHQKAFSVAKRTVSQDLRGLVDLDLVQKTGTTEKGVDSRLDKGAPKRHKGNAWLQTESSKATVNIR